MNKMPVINQVIKNKRKEKKITQLEFSKMINKSLGTVKRYDTGDLIPENTLYLICSVLGLNFYDLIITQDLENNTGKSLYYNELIKKHFRDEKDLNKDYEEKCKFLGDIFNAFYENFYHECDDIYCSNEEIEKTFFTTELKSTGIEIKKIYILKNKEKIEKTFDFFSFKEVDSFIDDLKENFNLKLFSLRKKRLKPELAYKDNEVNRIHSIFLEALENND